MVCVNINDPEFKKILEKSKNPLLAEIEYMEKYGLIDAKPSQESFHFKSSNIKYQKTSTSIIRTDLVVEEAAIRDLAERLSQRIGGKIKFENNINRPYAGYTDGTLSVINLAKATLDTPIHEIVGHPIIKAIKDVYLEGKELSSKVKPEYLGLDLSNVLGQIDILEAEERNLDFIYNSPFDNRPLTTEEKSRLKEIRESLNKLKEAKSSLIAFSKIPKNWELYPNLLKELETGYGKEVFERVKENYVYKNSSKKVQEELDYLIQKQNESTSNLYYEEGNESYDSALYEEQYLDYASSIVIPIEEKIQELKYRLNQKYTIEELQEMLFDPYTEEQYQEEAIVQLLGELTAGKIKDTKENKNLISLLKQLLKQMTDYMRSLFSSKEIKVEGLRADITLEDLSNLLAYTNSKIVLPNTVIEYNTPDGERFATYKEASNHITKLFKESKDVDVSDVSLQNVRKIELPDSFGHEIDKAVIYKEGGQWFYEQEDFLIRISEQEAIGYYLSSEIGKSETVQSVLDYDKSIVSFIERNKEFEQSKEIVETWKKENNIVYNPKEVYSRGQGFYSAIGAYSSLELDLLLKNLLQHIEDNKKAGGKFAISAYTKPIEKRIYHLEGDSSVRFVIYPKSEDILWASTKDVWSGSVWDASEKFAKGKKSEVAGVSYSKYPSLTLISSVRPNLADIIDRRDHGHNELGIELSTTNFRLEYDDTVSSEVKKIVNAINSMLDQKYGKIVKPNIAKEGETQLGYELSLFINQEDFMILEMYSTLEEAEENLKIAKEYHKDDLIGSGGEFKITPRKVKGIPPKQTEENTSSIDSIISELLPKAIKEESISSEEYSNAKVDEWTEDGETFYKDIDDSIRLVRKGLIYKKEILSRPTQNEYTEQALINLKIAKIKDSYKKYPRIFITSKVYNFTSRKTVSRNFGLKVKEGEKSEKLTTKDLLNEIETLEKKDKCDFILGTDAFDLPF
jgi:hypothetical protein